MSVITGLTAARMLAIEAASVVSGLVNGSNHLILTKHDGSTIDAGSVIGPQGVRGNKFFTTQVGVANINTISGSAVGDYIVNASTGPVNILGVTAQAGEFVLITAATTGTYAGTLRGQAATPPLVTALPGSPANAQECYLQSTQMATDSVPPWHLRYNGTTSKWDFLGGSEYYNEVTSGDETTASTGFTNLTTTGPTIIVPFTGLYIVELLISAFRNDVGGADAQVSLQRGATAADTANMMRTGGNALVPGSLKRRFSLTTGDTLQAKYATTTSGTIRVSGKRILTAKPVTLG